jgi:hypothetical protein
MTTADTTRDEARMVLERLRVEAVAVDPELGPLLSKDLVEAVFEVAWREQFDTEPAVFRSEVRGIVGAAAADAVGDH